MSLVDNVDYNSDVIFGGDRLEPETWLRSVPHWGALRWELVPSIQAGPSQDTWLILHGRDDVSCLVPPCGGMSAPMSRDAALHLHHLMAAEGVEVLHYAVHPDGGVVSAVVLEYPDNYRYLTFEDCEGL